MKTYEITIQEKVTYTKRAYVEVPKNMTDKEFDRLLDRLEMGVSSSGDLPFAAERMGKKVILVNPDDWSSPDESEMEITDYELKKDDKNA